MSKFGVDYEDDKRTLNDVDMLIGMLNTVSNDLRFHMELVSNGEGDADYMRGLLEAIIEKAGIK